MLMNTERCFMKRFSYTVLKLFIYCTKESRNTYVLNIHSHSDKSIVCFENSSVENSVFKLYLGKFM